MSTRVFVGGLTHKIRERDLEKFFKKYGRIKEVSMKNGYAFVEFDDHRDADDACYELNGKDLMGERITVERARGTPRGSDQWRGRDGGGRGYGGPPRGRNSGGGGDNSRTRDKYGPPTRTEYRVIIENLSSRCSWQDLKDIMRKAGEVTFADAHKLVPNEGVVEFVSYSDMKNAIEKLDDIEINGRRIRVIEDRRGGRKNNRSPSRSRSRSRRRSKSRSGSRSKSRSRSRSRSHSKENNRKRSNSRSEERN